MDEREKKNLAENEETELKAEQELSPTWAEDNIRDLDEWIEEQGIYLRQ